MRRAGLIAGLTVLVAGLLAPPASADYHVMKIKEITGDTAGGDASYIELQMYLPGQTNLAGHKLTFWDEDAGFMGVPGPIGEITLAGPPAPNGQDQRTVLIGDTGVLNRDFTAELSPFLESGPGTTLQVNGAVCFEAIPVDCVSWGAGFIGANNLPDNATPVGTSLSTGLLAFRRDITRGCATALDPADDTNNGANDFPQVPSDPTPNSATPTETPCVATPANTTKKKKCKKGFKLRKIKKKGKPTRKKCVKVKKKK